MLLKEFMRSAGLDDQAMAEKIGGISAFGVRKMRFRQRGPSIRVAARIQEITSGAVTPADLQPVKKPGSSGRAVDPGLVEHIGV